MKSALAVGRVAFGLALAALGILNLVYAEGVLGLEPVPTWVPGRAVLAYLSGLFLTAAGLVLASGRSTRAAATALGVLLAFWVAFLQLPPVVSAPYNGGLWTTTFETLALCCGAWVMAGEPRGVARAARLTFGASLFVFAALHVVYHEYVSFVIPSWIPFHPFWTYATAAAFAAAGVALLSGIRARLAATLLGAMFGSWVLIVHVPRVVGAPTVRAEWTSLFICLAMCGAGWIVAGRTPATERTV